MIHSAVQVQKISLVQFRAGLLEKESNNKKSSFKAWWNKKDYWRNVMAKRYE